MTREEFMDTLRDVKQRKWWQWEVNDWGELIAVVEHEHEYEEACPITAVCYAETGAWYDPTDYPWAAEKLDLPLADARDIVGASDGTEAYDTVLRSRLLRAVGLGADEPQEAA